MPGSSGKGMFHLGEGLIFHPLSSETYEELCTRKCSSSLDLAGGTCVERGRL